MARKKSADKPEGAKPVGRPSRYTFELSEHVCLELSNGKPLRQICREVGIDWTTIYEWRRVHKDFSERFAIAREIGEEAIAAECLEIADTPAIGIVKTYRGGEVAEAREEDMLGHRRLQIDTRLKLLAKWNPSKWGDKVEQTHKGDPNAPVVLNLIGSDIHG
jgi:transposase-like protein